MKEIIYTFNSFLIAFLCFFTLPSHAQNSCTNALYEANKLYEAGQLNECVQRLQACTASMNLEEKIESYHLLGLAYLDLNNLEMAKNYVKKLLKAQPDYKNFPNIDPLPFKKLLDEVEVKPSVNIGGNAGANLAWTKLNQSYSTYRARQEYKPVSGYQYGLNASYHIKNNWNVGAQINYSGLGINHVIDSAGGWRLRYSEEQKYIQFKAFAQFNHIVYKRVGMFGTVGFGAGYLTKSNVFFESTNLTSGSKQQVTQNALAYRNRMQYSVLGAIGISAALAKGVISIETGLESYFKNTVNAEQRMADLKFNFNTQYVNDDIALRVAFINVRYTMPIIWKIVPVLTKEAIK